jgi:hypothetical protein
LQVIDNVCEAALGSIIFDFKNSNLVINFERSSTGNKWKFTASGVIEYVGWDFRFTNIVQEIASYSGLDSSTTEVKELVFGALKGRAIENDDELSSPRVEEVLHRIVEGQLKVASLEAVFGSEMIILAERFELLSL